MRTLGYLKHRNAPWTYFAAGPGRISQSVILLRIRRERFRPYRDLSKCYPSVIEHFGGKYGCAICCHQRVKLIVRELMGEPPPPPPLGNFGDLYFQKPYTLSCSDQLVCTYIAGTFALEGQLKVGTSLILGVGVTL